jgi:hypothetical protein
VRRVAHLLGCLLAVASASAAQDTSAARITKITYLTGASAYIDAGRDDGLREGALVNVRRGGAVIGVLKVAFLASHQASCDRVSETIPIVVGDSVWYTAVAPPRDSTLAAGRTPWRAPARSALRGRIGTHYLVVGQGGGLGFTQPAFDVRLEGRPSGASPMGMAVDIRARRTFHNLTAGSDVTDQTRAYQLAVYWNPATAPARVTLGRQIAPGLPVVGMFDGVLAELSGRGWGSGVFAGTQPDPADLGFASDIVEGGFYVQRRGGFVRGGQWSGTLGASGSYQNGRANREFVFLQGSVSSRRLYTFVSQEIDYYRPWKRTGGTAPLSLTSTSATLRYRATPDLDVHVGFDNRRNVLLYRDVVNPATTFDDAFRQGVWAGVGWRVARRYSLALDARRSSGGVAGSANAYTLSLGADRLPGIGAGARVRSTYYRNRQLTGWLHSGALSVEPGIGLRIELSGGARMEHDPLALTNAAILWGGMDLDVNLARAWYLMLSAVGEQDRTERTTQLYGGVSLRF